MGSGAEKGGWNSLEEDEVDEEGDNIIEKREGVCGRGEGMCRARPNHSCGLVLVWRSKE